MNPNHTGVEYEIFEQKTVNAMPVARFAYAFLGICGFGVMPAFAQVQPQPQITEEISGSPSSPETADIAITSNVTARELRFNVVPDSEKIQFSGSAGRQTGWIVERRNIPKQVEEGVTYRDIGVRLQITSVFSDIDYSIVSDALGEAPEQEKATIQVLPSNSTAPHLPNGTLP